MPAGRHPVMLDARDLPGGVYFYRLRTGDEVQVPSKLVPYFKTGKELRE